MTRTIALLAVLLASLPFLAGVARAEPPAKAEPTPDEIAKKLAPLFKPPAELADDLGNYHSPLLFRDGTKVKDAAGWQKRREEILKEWHDLLGPWPDLI